MGALPRRSADELVTAATAAEWRAWLAANHARSSGVWLVFYKKHTGRPCIGYDEAVCEALCFGWIDSIKKRLDDDRYAFKLTPRKPGSSWSPSNKRRVAALVADGRMTPAGQALIDAARKDGSWDRPTAASADIPMPAELAAVLRASTAAKSGFDRLTPGQKRQYQAWIATARQPATRERRARKATPLLEQGRPLGMV